MKTGPLVTGSLPPQMERWPSPGPYGISNSQAIAGSRIHEGFTVQTEAVITFEG